MMLMNEFLINISCSIRYSSFPLVHTKRPAPIISMMPHNQCKLVNNTNKRTTKFFLFYLTAENHTSPFGVSVICYSFPTRIKSSGCGVLQ